MSTSQRRVRWAGEGVSKDCICTSSSLTTPPTPSLVMEALVMAGVVAAAVAEPAAP